MFSVGSFSHGMQCAARCVPAQANKPRGAESQEMAQCMDTTHGACSAKTFQHETVFSQAMSLLENESVDSLKVTMVTVPVVTTPLISALSDRN